MFGAICGSLLLELSGYQHQLSLELDIPSFELDPASFCSITVKWSGIDGTGSSTGSISSVDHPSFAALRKHLNSKGFIRMSTNSVNGDVVLKEFKLNGKLFSPGDRFLCAAAMKHTIGV